jgi:hypothetical protein
MPAVGERRTHDLEAGRIARALRTTVVLALLGVFAYVAWASTGFMLGARLFPQFVGTFGVVLCLIELAHEAWRRGRAGAPDGPGTADLILDAEEQTTAGYLRALRLFGWILAYYVLIWVAGLVLATAVFVPALLRLQFGARWLPSLSIAGGLLVLIGLLQWLLMLRFPTGYLPLPF